MSNAICVLSRTEAGRLEHWGIWPACKAHIHIKRKVAVAGAESGEFRFVNDMAGNATSMITLAGQPDGWVPVQCHGLNGRAILGLRTWGNRATR